jgi:hypothetical protein
MWEQVGTWEQVNINKAFRRSHARKMMGTGGNKTRKRARAVCLVPIRSHVGTDNGNASDP